jgi:hypothetical protein
VVSGRPVHPVVHPLLPPPQIAGTDDHRHVNAMASYRLDFGSKLSGSDRVDSTPPDPTKRFSAHFEQYTLVSWSDHAICPTKH